jgi:GT2 family glycosyltransferase
VGAPAVSVVIVAYGHAEYVEACLTSFLASTPPAGGIEWLLGDNGSPDGTAAVLDVFATAARARGWSAEVTRFGENLGAVRGRNRLMELARGEKIVFLDSDVALRSRDWLVGLARRLDEDQRRAIVAPKLVYPRPPYNIQCAGCAVTRGGRVLFRGRGEPRATPEWNKPAELQALISACWIFPRALWEELGPLDEAFSPIQFEDTDYCYRARAAGRTVFYAPEVELYHCENVTSGRSPTLNYKYHVVRNGKLFAERWRAMIAAEDGPPDAAWSWTPIAPITLAEVRGLPVI